MSTRHGNRYVIRFGKNYYRPGVERVWVSRPYAHIFYDRWQALLELWSIRIMEQSMAPVLVHLVKPKSWRAKAAQRIRQEANEYPAEGLARPVLCRLAEQLDREDKCP